MDDEEEEAIKKKSRSVIFDFWNHFKVLDLLSGMLLPSMFIFWYATTYLENTFKHDPFEVTIFELFK